MKNLDKLTLIAVDCVNVGLAIDSLQKSLKQIKPARTILFTDREMQINNIDIIVIPTIKSKDEYSKFIIKELYKYFDTDFVLITQWDSWVLNGDSWDDDFYNYDIISAPWLYIDGRNIGCGGFSLRSKKLQKILGTDTNIYMYAPEDEVIGRLYRQYLEETYWIKYPSDDIGDKFAFELREPKYKTFGFHSGFHQPYRETVILKRSGALGDIVQLEPIAKYFFLNGYNVILDIPIAFFELFNQHYFMIKHISNFDVGRIPAKEINFDMAYEIKPKQLYQKSYFEIAGIKDYKIQRPQLYPYVNHVTKLFKKYAVIHIDERDTEHRNIYGVDWVKIKKYLEANGYVVIQVGANKHQSCGIEINTPSVGFLKFVIAGADLFIGVDSGPSHIAVAHNIPSVIFFGSVNPNYIHADLTNVEIIQGNCSKSYCWHTVGSTDGNICAFKGTNQYLQCCKSDWEAVVESIKKLTYQQ